jgi:transposase
MERQYVGIDLHRRSTTIFRMNEDGEMLGCERILSQPTELAEAIAEAGEAPEVVLESTYGWYWAADVLQSLGCNVHLAHALGNNWGNRRVKNDERDARTWRRCCGSDDWPRVGSHPQRRGNCASSSAIGTLWSDTARAPRPRSTG